MSIVRLLFEIPKIRKVTVSYRLQRLQAECTTVTMSQHLFLQPVFAAYHCRKKRELVHVIDQNSFAGVSTSH
jgi:hypothetical protein